MAENNGARPLDILNNAKGKTVLVELKNGHAITGKLVSFDVHINIAVENAEDKKDGELVRKLGTIFLRGDTIVMISPTV